MHTITTPHKIVDRNNAGCEWRADLGALVDLIEAARESEQVDATKVRRMIRPLLSSLKAYSVEKEMSLDPAVVQSYSVLKDFIHVRARDLAFSSIGRGLVEDIMQCLVARHKSLVPFPWHIPSDLGLSIRNGEPFDFVIC